MISSNRITGFQAECFWRFMYYNVFVSARHKLVYVATPKAACTTVKWWFAQLEGCTDRILARRDTKECSSDMMVHDGFRIAAPEVNGLCRTRLDDVLSGEEWFRFALVRNPYRRVFSAWQSKILFKDPMRMRHYPTTAFAHMRIMAADDLSAAFEKFLEHVKLHENDPDKYRDPHWTPQAALLRPDLVRYHLICRMEDPAPLEAVLMKQLGSSYYSPLGALHANESLLPFCREIVSDQAAQLICEIFQNDFNTFKYDITPPYSTGKFEAAHAAIAVKAIEIIRGRHDRLAALLDMPPVPGSSSNE